MSLRLSLRVTHGRAVGRLRSYATEAAVHASKPSPYGQPLAASHAHLVQQNEITPGIPSEEYERRRRQLMESLPNESIVISVAAPIKYMSGQIFYKYRQHSDFWYLTGFEEPNSAVILEKNSTSRGYRMTMFSQGKDSAREKWDGASTSFHDVASQFRSDDAKPIASFGSTLKSLLALSSNVYVDLPPSASSSRRTARMGIANTTKSVLQYLSPGALGKPKSEYDTIVEGLSGHKRRPLAPEVGRFRAVKSVHEQKVMRGAADISSLAHTKTMRFARPGLSEGALAAHFEYICALQGAQRPAYVPVVASGANSLVIHYVANNHLIREGELILVDAGCEYNGYASDITRTYPVTGSFTPAQRDLYAAVLSAQKQLVALCSESAGLSLNDLHRRSCDLLRRELNQLNFGLMTGDLERVLYPHYLSHSIGIDLHESAHFDRMGPLKEGMVITVEPGIYVPPTANFPKHFHELGIRIEDQVLVGKKDPVVLSVSAPKEIVDVEGACQGLLGLEPY